MSRRNGTPEAAAPPVEPVADPAEGFALNGEPTGQETDPTSATAPKPKAKRMVLDPEIQAMQTINDLLADLSDEAQSRVVAWSMDRYVRCNVVKAG